MAHGIFRARQFALTIKKLPDWPQQQQQQQKESLHLKTLNLDLLDRSKRKHTCRAVVSNTLVLFASHKAPALEVGIDDSVQALGGRIQFHAQGEQGFDSRIMQIRLLQYLYNSKWVSGTPGIQGKSWQGSREQEELVGGLREAGGMTSGEMLTGRFVFPSLWISVLGGKMAQDESKSP